MRNNSPRTWRFAVSTSLIVAGFLMGGCDRSPPMNPDISIDQHVTWLVRDIDDRVSSPGELPLAKKIFAQGHEPSKEALQRYTAYRYQAKQPVQNGDSAKVTVVVKDAKTGQPAGEVQWSATKVGDVWKLTDAPLPAK